MSEYSFYKDRDAQVFAKRAKRAMASDVYYDALLAPLDEAQLGSTREGALELLRRLIKS